MIRSQRGDCWGELGYAWYWAIRRPDLVLQHPAHVANDAASLADFYDTLQHRSSASPNTGWQPSIKNHFRANYCYSRTYCLITRVLQGSALYGTARTSCGLNMYKHCTCSFRVAIIEGGGTYLLNPAATSLRYGCEYHPRFSSVGHCITTFLSVLWEISSRINRTLVLLPSRSFYLNV